jgi:Fic family protein
MIGCLQGTSQLSNQKIDEILAQMDSTYKYANSKFKWYSIELNQVLFSQPYIKQKLVGEITRIRSRTTITKYMLQLTELGILSAKEDGREVFYVNNDLIRILES